jgi:hypothetical protein
LICIQQAGKKGKKGGLTGERNLARCALEVDDDEFLVVDDGDGVADDMQKRTANSGMATRWSIASSRGGGKRLEMMQCIGDVGHRRRARFSAKKHRASMLGNALETRRKRGT